MTVNTVNPDRTFPPGGQYAIHRYPSDVSANADSFFFSVITVGQERCVHRNWPILSEYTVCKLHLIDSSRSNATNDRHAPTVEHRIPSAARRIDQRNTASGF